ncbi:MAG: nucleoside triphosphate pyrophosphohydrolase [Vicingaceae bacterium]
MDKRLVAFERLLNIMDDLRAKCPWDKKQTIESLRHLTIEETYELADAIIEKDMQEIKKELGDLMLHIVFYAKIASESNAFDITDVLNSICDKLIERHPHIYGDVDVKDEEEVKANWEKIKLKTGNKSVLGGVPKSLPSMVKAIRIQDKARGVGFDWENKEQVWEKLQEELSELKHEVDHSTDRIEEELGDVIFSIINYARFLNLNPEDALEKTNKKFIKRFHYMEEKIQSKGLQISDLKLEELDKYWDEAKSI